MIVTWLLKGYELLQKMRITRNILKKTDFESYKMVENSFLRLLKRPWFQCIWVGNLPLLITPRKMIICFRLGTPRGWLSSKYPDLWRFRGGGRVYILFRHQQAGAILRTSSTFKKSDSCDCLYDKRINLPSETHSESTKESLAT